MKRVAFVTTNLTRKGTGVFAATRGLAQSLYASGKNEVTVFGADSREHLDDIASWSPVPLIRLSARANKFAYIPGLVRELASWKPDVIHAHGIWQYLSLATLLAKARTGAKLIVSPHGQLAPTDLVRSRKKKRLASLVYQNRQLRKADCLHALCELEVEQFRALGLANPICRVPNGTELSLEEGRDILPPWSDLVSSGRNVLLYLGRIHQVKGLDSLLNAWRDWKASGPAASWVLALAGWGAADYTATIKQAADAGPDIVFLGPVYGLAKSSAYFHADAFILPSQGEALPMVVLEAWAAGTFVLMTERCNLPEGFAANAAIRIEADARSIRQGLDRLAVMTPEERRAAGDRGHEIVKSRYSWEIAAVEIDRVYDWLLATGARPESVTCV